VVGLRNSVVHCGLIPLSVNLLKLLDYSLVVILLLLEVNLLAVYLK